MLETNEGELYYKSIPDLQAHIQLKTKGETYITVKKMTTRDSVLTYPLVMALNSMSSRLASKQPQLLARCFPARGERKLPIIGRVCAATTLKSVRLKLTAILMGLDSILLQHGETQSMLRQGKEDNILHFRKLVFLNRTVSKYV